MSKSKVALSLIFILTIGLFLRMYGLDKYDFWYDEAVTALIAKTLTLQSTLHYSTSSLGKFPGPPLFYLLLKFWMLLGKSEFILRLLPLIFGFLSIITIYFVGKVLLNKKIGLISAFLLTISPFHIYYSQELRAYSLVTLLSLISIYCFVRVLKETKLSIWICFVFFTTLCLYTHSMSSFLLVAAENVYFFLFYKRYKKVRLMWCISQLAILLFYAPWLVVLIRQIPKAQTFSIFFWVPRPSIQVIIHTFNIFNLGYNATRMLYLYAMFAFFPLFLLGIWEARREKAKICLLLCWLFVPIIMAILISLMLKPVSIYLYRVFINISPAYYLIVAYGLNSIKKYTVWIIPLSLIIILSIFSLQNQYNNIFFLTVAPYRPGIFAKKEYKSPADYIKKDFQEGDIIAHTSRATVVPFIYYHNNKLEQKWVVSPNNIDWLHWRDMFSGYSPPSHSSLNRSFFAVDIKKLSEDYRRIWLVFSGWGINHRESPEIKQWLDNNCKILKEKDFDGLSIYLYKVNEKKYPKLEAILR